MIDDQMASKKPSRDSLAITDDLQCYCELNTPPCWNIWILVCYEVFASVSNMNQHIVHGVCTEPAVGNLRRKMCPFCGTMLDFNNDTCDIFDHMLLPDCWNTIDFKRQCMPYDLVGRVIPTEMGLACVKANFKHFQNAAPSRQEKDSTRIYQINAVSLFIHENDSLFALIGDYETDQEILRNHVSPRASSCYASCQSVHPKCHITFYFTTESSFSLIYITEILKLSNQMPHHVLMQNWLQL